MDLMLVDIINKPNEPNKFTICAKIEGSDKHSDNSLDARKPDFVTHLPSLISALVIRYLENI